MNDDNLVNELADVAEAAFLPEIKRLKARIEQLEAALRIFADDENWRFGRRLDPSGSRFDGVSTACAALDQSSPPARQENDDVYIGFRGNNEA